MKRPRLRSILSIAAFLAIVAIVWWYFAPTQIGGSTRYVVTGGVSMEPRFHTGDLAVVRPVSQYKVGDIVAYWSTLLHTVVLHRIHAIVGNTYLFKGDNNDFIDPVHPTRDELLGKLWLHAPSGGVWLNRLHSPAGIAIICALLGALVLFGASDQRRRRKRRRKDATGSGPPRIPVVNKPRDNELPRRFNYGALLTASAVAAAVCVVLGLFAFTRPNSKPTAKVTRYSQQVKFGYTAHVTPGPVYPRRTIKTGDPIFLTLVHGLTLHIDYSAVGLDPSTVKGTEEVVLKLVGPSGWSRNYVLTPPTHFASGRTSTDVPLDLSTLQRQLAKVARLTGNPGVGTFSIDVGPRVKITGAVHGHPIKTTFAPTLALSPQGGQLTVNAASGSIGGSTGSSASQAANYTPSQTGTVSSPATAPATITVLGVSPQIATLRWIALLGLLISGAIALYAFLRKRGEPFEESVHIQSQYGHLIVPIVAGEDLGWPPVDVPSIKSLVRLAESGQRLILHTRSDNVDTYLVNEEGTVYRYQVKPSKVIWGEWTETPVQAAA